MNALLFRCCKQILGKRLVIPNANTARLISQVVRTTDFDESKDAEQGKFSKYNISEKMENKLKDAGINHLFAVQYDTFDHIKEGKDAIVQARTGTGKTLAFALPILENLHVDEDELCVKKGRSPVVLALAPTRELALQIHKEFEKFKSGKMNVSCFYGGCSYHQQDQDLYNGIDILIGTPGRILDHISKNNLDLTNLKHVILDEADRMLDMGFKEELEQILSSAYTEGNKPQTLLFSATMPPWVRQTAKKYTSIDTKRFDLVGTAVKSAVLVEHKAIRCSYRARALTIRDLMQVHSGKYGKTLIFTSTKQEANELALNSVISADCQVLHGDIGQQQREITLDGFRNDKFNCLIATDVAARGLDIPKIDLVIQTEPPQDLDSYIHRAGRTGRAGKNGVCIVLYKRGQESGMEAVQESAGISFTEISVPSKDEVLLSYANDALRSLDEVKPDAVEHFLSSAKGRIESQGAENALAAALAVISGVTEMGSRKHFNSSSHDSFRNNNSGRGSGDSFRNNNRGHGSGDSFKSTNRGRGSGDSFRNNNRGRGYDSFNNDVRGRGYGDSFNDNFRGRGRGYGNSFNNNFRGRGRGYGDSFNDNVRDRGYGDSFNDNVRGSGYRDSFNDNVRHHGYGARGGRGNKNSRYNNWIDNFEDDQVEDDQDYSPRDTFDNQGAKFNHKDTYRHNKRDSNNNKRYNNWASTFEEDDLDDVNIDNLTESFNRIETYRRNSRDNNNNKRTNNWTSSTFEDDLESDDPEGLK